MKKLNKEKIKILIVEPYKEPYIKEIEHKLEKMQEIVGGLIEFVELGENVDLICNEEGKIHNLEINRIITNDIVCGTFFIAGQKEGDTISLTDEQIKKYTEYFKLSNHKTAIKLLKNEYKRSVELLGNDLIGVEKLLQLGDL